MEEEIKEALLLMDADDDDQWTNDGAPKVDKVAELGMIQNLKRADIINAAPKFSRTSFDLSESEPSEDEPETAPEVAETAPEVEDDNTQGYNHPDIVAAQDDYDSAVKALAEAKVAEKQAGEVLNEVTNRLMKQTYDKTANTRQIQAAIAASNAARAGRVADFNASKALLTGRPPRSALDEAKAGERKVRPRMT